MFINNIWQQKYTNLYSVAQRTVNTDKIMLIVLSQIVRSWNRKIKLTY